MNIEDDFRGTEIDIELVNSLVPENIIDQVVTTSDFYDIMENVRRTHGFRNCFIFKIVNRAEEVIIYYLDNVGNSSEQKFVNLKGLERDKINKIYNRFVTPGAPQKDDFFWVEEIKEKKILADFCFSRKINPYNLDLSFDHFKSVVDFLMKNGENIDNSENGTDLEQGNGSGGINGQETEINPNVKKIRKFLSEEIAILFVINCLSNDNFVKNLEKEDLENRRKIFDNLDISMKRRIASEEFPSTLKELCFLATYRYEVNNKPFFSYENVAQIFLAMFAAASAYFLTADSPVATFLFSIFSIIICYMENKSAIANKSNSNETCMFFIFFVCICIFSISEIISQKHENEKAQIVSAAFNSLSFFMFVITRKSINSSLFSPIIFLTQKSREDEKFSHLDNLKRQVENFKFLTDINYSIDKNNSISGMQIKFQDGKAVITDEEHDLYPSKESHQEKIKNLIENKKILDKEVINLKEELIHHYEYCNEKFSRKTQLKILKKSQEIIDKIKSDQNCLNELNQSLDDCTTELSEFQSDQHVGVMLEKSNRLIGLLRPVSDYYIKFSHELWNFHTRDNINILRVLIYLSESVPYFMKIPNDIFPTEFYDSQFTDIENINNEVQFESYDIEDLKKYFEFFQKLVDSILKRQESLIEEILRDYNTAKSKLTVIENDVKSFMGEYMAFTVSKAPGLRLTAPCP